MPELQEKDFIQERYGKDPYPFWLWLFLLAAFTTTLWFFEGWIAREVRTDYTHNPFLQVTNRDLSLFLWQFPEKMRINASQKSTYLPAFQYEEKVTLFPDQADEWVSAPPELLFLYHTWKRQIGDIWFPRPILKQEFIEFINYAEEWKPDFWPKAPESYLAFYNKLSSVSAGQDVANQLPLPVRQAFQGWKNFYKEGERINQLKITPKILAEFFKKYPHYARNYWQNLYSEYIIKSNPPFLKTALYNFTFSNKNT